jgi:hypothetical protein
MRDPGSLTRAAGVRILSHHFLQQNK